MNPLISGKEIVYDAAYYRCYTREEKYICKVDRPDACSQDARLAEPDLADVKL